MRTIRACALTEIPRTAPTSRSRKMHAKNGGKKIEKVCNHGWQYVSAAVRAKRKIRKVRKTYSEYTPIFGHEEHWMDSRTATSYLAGLVENLRWEGDRYHAYALICKEADHEIS